MAIWRSGGKVDLALADLGRNHLLGVEMTPAGGLNLTKTGFSKFDKNTIKINSQIERARFTLPIERALGSLISERGPWAQWGHDLG